MKVRVLRPSAVWLQLMIGGGDNKGWLGLAAVAAGWAGTSPASPRASSPDSPQHHPSIRDSSDRLHHGRTIICSVHGHAGHGHSMSRAPSPLRALLTLPGLEPCRLLLWRCDMQRCNGLLWRKVW